MKYCSHCGKELFDEAVICPGCGCACVTQNTAAFSAPINKSMLIKELSDKVRINGIIWIAIAIIQIIIGICLNWIVLIVGVLNLISSIKDLSYCNDVITNPTGIVKRFEPITMPIIILIYNAIFGGVIGVAGSVYYLVAIRNFVLNNRAAFDEIEYEFSLTGTYGN